MRPGAIGKGLPRRAGDYLQVKMIDSWPCYRYLNPVALLNKTSAMMNATVSYSATQGLFSLHGWWSRRKALGNARGTHPLRSPPCHGQGDLGRGLRAQPAVRPHDSDWSVEAPGWGTWIRTKDARVRAGSFTAKLSPNGILPDQTRRQRGGGISMVSLQGQHGERMLLAPVGFARRQCRVKLSQDHLCLKGSLIRWMISPPLPPDQVPPGQVPMRGAAPMGRLSRRWTSGRIIADCWWAHRRGTDFA